jgi:hypothetical protein
MVIQECDNGGDSLQHRDFFNRKKEMGGKEPTGAEQLVPEIFSTKPPTKIWNLKPVQCINTNKNRMTDPRPWAETSG